VAGALGIGQTAVDVLKLLLHQVALQSRLGNFKKTPDLFFL
jgi:hypothetical protein